MALGIPAGATTLAGATATTPTTTPATATAPTTPATTPSQAPTSTTTTTPTTPPSAAAAPTTTATPAETPPGTSVTTCDAQSPNVLDPGGEPSLTSGACLISPNQQYELIMQTDGNLVLYYQTSARALWSSDTVNNPGAFFRLQTNGFMGVLNSTNSVTLWAPSEPWVGEPVNAVLVLQDDGNLVLYDTLHGDVRALWATGTDNLVVSTISGCDASSPNQMQTGQMEPGGCLISTNQQYELIMQTDGNLVLYYKTAGSPEWASNTAGNPGAFLELKATGYMAVYTPSFATPWVPNEPGVTSDNTIVPVLVVQNDGNVVLYRTQQNSSGGVSVLWATNTQEPSNGSTLAGGQTLHVGHTLTSPNGHVTLVMQQDGNLVAEFDGDGATAYWATGTEGNPRAFLAMQSDGNLILYQQGSTVGTGNGALWSDGCPGCNQTYPQPGNFLAVQNDGNIVVYNASGKALWSSNTVVAASGDNLGSTLSVGQTMNGGDYMQSPNGQYQFYNQSNVVSGGTPGSLEIYTSVPSSGVACQLDQWADPTSIVNGNGQVTEAYADGAYLQLTSSGDLVYYYKNTESGTNVSWDAGVSGGSLLTLQNDGNLVLYGTPSSPGAAAPVVWSSGTNTNRGNALCAGESLQQGQYIAYGADYLIMQTDNNLVLYPWGSTSALWATGTEHNGGTDSVTQQADGNFVMYNTSNSGVVTAVGATNTVQSTSSKSWTFQLGTTGVNNNNPAGQWAMQVYNTATGDYAWYADAKKPTGSLVDPPSTSQISHGAQAVLNLTTFILTG
ncbi:MAG TPA: hypothetical protein VNV87_08935 [Acidimicrobiales bacterium]|jgi:hypothetical protein|nr:hypothetical protein [Acidimicrobiales bacterium]